MKYSFALGFLSASLAWTVAVLTLLLIRLWWLRSMWPTARVICDDSPSLVPSDKPEVTDRSAIDASYR